jgi:hypothetical protein
MGRIGAEHATNAIVAAAKAIRIPTERRGLAPEASVALDATLVVATLGELALELLIASLELASSEHARTLRMHHIFL